MSRLHRIGSYSDCYFDYAAKIARKQAAAVARSQGKNCVACSHPMHGGRCQELNLTPLSPMAHVPTFCPCGEGKA